MDKTIKSKVYYIRDYVEWLPKAEWELKDFIETYYSFLYLHLLMQSKFKNRVNRNEIISYELQEVKDSGFLDKKEFKERLNFANNILKELRLKDK